MQQKVSVSEFKAKCLAIVDRVATSRRSLLITRHGKPVARLVPVEDDLPSENPLKGSIVHQGDIVSPTDARWNAES